MAGAFCRLASVLPVTFGPEIWRSLISHEVPRDKRAYKIGEWLATNQGSLRHVLLHLEMDDDGLIHCSAQSFAAAI
jgi:hypothetical protein